MARYVGVLLPSGYGVDCSVTPDLAVRNAWTVGNAVPAASTALVGARVSQAPIEMHPTARAGVPTASFTREAYGRVVAIPASIDIGTIATNQERTCELWNASLTDVTVNSVTATGMASIATNAPATPFTIPALHGQVITYTIGMSGPIDINALQTIICGSNAVVMAITGTRAIVLAVWPQDGIEEKLAWLTDIITAWKGAEQRIKVRMEPRREFKVILWPGTPAAAQRWENRTQAWRANHWALPLYSEAERLTAPPAQGDYAVAVDTRRMTLDVGDMAMVWWSDEISQTFPVAAMTATGITFTRPLSPPVGHTGPIYAVPVHYARLAASPTKERRAGYLDKWTMDFRLDEDRDVADGLALPQYLGLDVFAYPSKYLQSATQPVTYTRVVSELDYASGKCYFAGLSDYTAQQIQLDITAVDKAAAFTAHQFFARRMGRVVPFWYPLYDVYMSLISDIGSSDTTLIVVDCQFSLLSGQDTRGHLFLETITGEQYYRQITSIVQGDTGEIVTMDTPIGVNVAKSHVKYLCFLGKFRLDEDTVSMTWGTSPTLQASTMLLEVGE